MMNAKFRLLPTIGAASLAAALAGCSSVDMGQEGAPMSSAAPYPATVATAPGTPAVVAAAQVPVVEYGRVTNVSLVSGTPIARATPGRSAAGTVIGAIVGGLLGNQIGRGVGRTAATVLGAGAGAAAGNNIANRTAPNAYATANPVYRVEVQTDQGVMRTYDVSATGDLHVGDRVRIENGVIYLA
ncbi:MAG TPA: glycine zipper 2TM domain-containing protein [Ramlibacter sp.]|nr:glycine zipper 2TM domain-containing protein [Ramlibacter sp.]